MVSNFEVFFDDIRQGCCEAEIATRCTYQSYHHIQTIIPQLFDDVNKDFQNFQKKIKISKI